ncbi:hypothetical protein TVAG_390280 [Trichomonas vaginalis G3]|uniref:Uncharacterized protein n=1 Tax=Trichomonas vaginalis (strain ATCC PRA-98 / G3) TaxID=412133 RepID=A2EST2_TRIV3|nr:hypothetical protein TVAGG3_0181890 [Trichomonas vaginalis G3]EAY04258.1 hypothetical protein TVAG_390280 [Trichomonas vaginalis G3]KAI5549351.1 hypothetical protein TVAGG3_0181890 [Trichomonas vaginalis G3]|eukprot:XP_001316481.1 hypothetical protein [Trichomonas vaginalis G3]
MFEAQQPFYTDYEIYKGTESYQSSYEPPDVTAISELPTSHFSAYMESFTPNYQDSSFDSIKYCSASFSFTEMAGSFDSDGSFLMTENTNDVSNNGNSSQIDTPQIKRFWALYGEYPQYLKKIKKRNKRKAKKVAKLA